MRAATGQQIELTRQQPGGASRAIITEVAAGLRSLEVHGTALVESFAEEDLPPLACGIVLVPWPNRIADGVWSLDGLEQQLDLTEPARHHAIHGLLRHTAYRVLERSEAAVTMAATVFPRRGYPFLLDTTVRYELVDDGIVVTHVIRNDSSDAAPVAIGAHPYLRVGEIPTAELTLRLAADTHFEVGERMIPVRETPVGGTAYDLRAGRPVGALQLDDGFRAAQALDSGTRHTLTAPDGRFVELWQDAQFGFVQVFTTDRFPSRELAIAVEPMTAPANAFNSGLGVRWLEPGESWQACWGINYGVGA
jgi:aldose 1-epimerase